jgi:hypothetical protein
MPHQLPATICCPKVYTTPAASRWWPGRSGGLDATKNSSALGAVTQVSVIVRVWEDRKTTKKHERWGAFFEQRAKMEERDEERDGSSQFATTPVKSTEERKHE